jgi:hypothetical protein
VGTVKDTYEIRVKGHLDRRWAGYFEGLTMTWLPDGETMLFGEIVDQAALHSILSRIRDLGLVLVLVKRIEN